MTQSQLRESVRLRLLEMADVARERAFTGKGAPRTEYLEDERLLRQAVVWLDTFHEARGQ